jgi:hypothetical protein
MKRTFIASTIAIFFAFSGSASAELIESDYLTAGDNGTFTDTRTGLTFLDFDYTRGQSINDAKLRTQDGGDLVGWRMATVDDVESLFFSITGIISNGAKTTIRYSGNSIFRAVSGTPYSDSSGETSYGLFEGYDNNVYLMGANTYISTTYHNYLRSSNLNYSANVDSVYMIKDATSGFANDFASNVPVPLMGFVGLGLLALGMRRKNNY